MTPKEKIMLIVRDLPTIDEFGSNGWYQQPDRATAHYFVDCKPLCGCWYAFPHVEEVVLFIPGSHKCRSCSRTLYHKVRCNMREYSDRFILIDGVAIRKKSHNPGKPQ